MTRVDEPGLEGEPSSATRIPVERDTAARVSEKAPAVEPAREGTGQEPRALEDLVLARLREYASSLKGHDARDMYGLIMPQLERPLIRVALELAGGRQSHAATMLGIHRNTLRVRLRELGLEPEKPPRRGGRG